MFLEFAKNLEQAGDLTGFGVNVNTAVCGVSSSTGHHGDGTSHGAQELSAAVLQNVTDGQLPPDSEARSAERRTWPSER